MPGIRALPVLKKFWTSPSADLGADVESSGDSPTRMARRRRWPGGRGAPGLDFAISIARAIDSRADRSWPAEPLRNPVVTVERASALANPGGGLAITGDIAMFNAPRFDPAGSTDAGAIFLYAVDDERLFDDGLEVTLQ
jgi:hypothetical protein